MADPNVAPAVTDAYDPLLEYVVKLANHRCPDFDGEDLQPSIVPLDFLRQYPNLELEYPFTYAGYKNEHEILATMTGFGLDEDKFWYAIVFIYYLTIEKFTDAVPFEQSTTGQMRILHEYLSGRNVSITVKKRGRGKSMKTITVTNKQAIEIIRDILADKIEAEKDNQGVNMSSAERKTYSKTLMMGFMTELFLELFNLLKLDARKGQLWNKFVREFETEGYNIDVSYERLLLISRIIYFVRLTDNDSFMFSSDSLRGILARCAKDNPDFKTGITRQLIPI